jgi:hypothetical protein
VSLFVAAVYSLISFSALSAALAYPFDAAAFNHFANVFNPVAIVSLSIIVLRPFQTLITIGMVIARVVKTEINLSQPLTSGLDKVSYIPPSIYNALAKDIAVFAHSTISSAQVDCTPLDVSILSLTPSWLAFTRLFDSLN